jgi:hypothetical protein
MEGVMYIVREVVNCKPGKAAQMVERFKAVSTVMREMGYEPFRVLTDVTGGPFWTVIAETAVEKTDDFFAMERKLMSSEAVRKALAGYHDVVAGGRREIYRLEG